MKDDWIPVIILSLLSLFLIWVVVLTVQYRKLKKRFGSFINRTGVSNLDGIVDDLYRKLDDLMNSVHMQNKQITTLEHKTNDMPGKIGVVRFNAFDDNGSDLSFSLAIVNERQDGVVLSTIRSRAESYIYAKPLSNGSSAYVLTPEEKEAINLALQKN